jgi:CO/xanthine dehydrogenase FAD-binding subunit
MIHVYGPGEDRRSVATVAAAPLGLDRTELVSPRSTEDACAVLAAASSSGRRVTLLAGGTDWVVDRHLADPTRATPVDLVVDLGRIEALSAIDSYEKDGVRRLRLGAGVTYRTLRRDPRVAQVVPVLARMAADVGAVQIQAKGTLGGNLATASPAADGVAALMALEAELTIASREGTRQVGIESFFTGYRKTVMGPAEMLTAIDVRVPGATAIARWQKVGTRRAQAISKVALASVIEVERGLVTRARFGMASVAASTAPLVSVRSALEGETLAAVDRTKTDAAVEKDIRPIDDVRSTGEYRLHVAKTLVWRALSRPRDASP